MINEQLCGLVLDALYRNCQRRAFEQKSAVQLADDCDTKPAIIRSVIKLLIETKLITVEGQTRSRRMFWVKGKCAPNPQLTGYIYKQLGHTPVKTPVIKEVKPTGKISLERALHTLISLGYTGVIERVTHSGIHTQIDRIDLSNIQVED